MARGLTVTYDLGDKTRTKTGEELRAELLELLLAQPPGALSFRYGAYDLYPTAGTSVKIHFPDFFTEPETVHPFSSLNTERVCLSVESTDKHSPAAGIYRHQMRNGAIQATVVHRTRYGFPEGDLQRVVDTIRAMTGSGQVIIPVVGQHYWEITIIASLLEEAIYGYEQIRSGKWEPVAPFKDAIPDTPKVELLGYVVTPVEPAKADET